MNDKNTTYSKQVIEIADYIFANPEKKISNEISVFCSKFQKTERTIWNYVKQAQEYNKSRLQKQEKAKDEVLVEQAKKDAENGLKSRNNLLKVYWDVVNEFEQFKNNPYYKPKEVGEEVLLPTVQDLTQVGKEIAKIEGYYEPTKLNIDSNETVEITFDL